MSGTSKLFDDRTKQEEKVNMKSLWIDIVMGTFGFLNSFRLLSNSVVK